MDLTRASARRKHKSMSKLNKVATVEEAVALIGDNDWITTTGFVGTGIPEEIIIGVKERFEKTGHPRNLSLVFAAGQGDGKGRGVDLLSVHPGLLHTVVGGHYGLIPGIGKLALDNKVIAYNLPQGIISQMYRAVANKQPGIISKIGLGTFVDPRLEGGKVNCLTKKDIVSVIQVGNEEYLHYQPFKLDVAFVRGTTADLDGNVTMEKEALTLDSLAIAMATKNCGGRVIVQVERLAAEGTLNPHQVKIPGVLVDYIVVSRPENHRQTLASEDYNAGFSGEVHVPTSSFLGKMPFSARKIICRRAALELKPYGIINLGIGVPEGVALIANEEKVLKMLTMTAEPGIIGGIISGGLNFGTAVNPRSIIDQNTQFDFYDGGGLDTTFLGMAQVDQHGNVNVSKFGKKLAGCGGFINISQSTKHVVFLGTFTNGDTKLQMQSGKLVLHGDGETRKFVNQVQQITFSGKTAVKNKQHVIYITERCVFKLVEEGLEIIEVAPGIDIDRDILPKMEFTPIIKRESIRTMDPRVFENKLMELRQSMIHRFLEHRIDYDAADNILFIDLKGIKLTSFEVIDSIMQSIEERCKEIGKKCFAIINYTTMQMDRDAIKELLSSELKIARDYFLKVSRFAVGNGLRYNLQTVLQKLDPTAVVFRSLEEAVESVNFKAKL